MLFDRAPLSLKALSRKLPDWLVPARLFPCFILVLAATLAGQGIQSTAFGAVSPANDTCSGAEQIPSAGPFPYLSAITADVTGANVANDPPTPACVTGTISRSIWYQFVPSATKLYTISTGDDTATTVSDTVMAIYAAPNGCNGPFTQVACNDDSGSLRAAISTTLNSGTTYYIVIWVSGASAPPAGRTAVQVRISQPVVPVNDTCAGAMIIPAMGPFPYLTPSVDTTLATTIGDPPAPSCNTNFSRSVWFRFTPASTAIYELSTCADTSTTVYDTLMAIYTSSSGCGGPYSAVACNDNACGTKAAVTVSLTAGTAYYIVIWEADTEPYTPGETAVQLRVSGYFPPTVQTIAASGISSTGAVLNATINPNHVVTTAWFEWGTTTNYGNVTAPQSIGAGSVNVPMSATISALASSKTYFFRGVATNNMGSTTGTNRTFFRSTVAPAFTDYNRTTNGVFHSQFIGNPGQIYLIQSSTDLSNWPTIASGQELGGGLFEFDDFGSTNAHGFYRIFSP
jgi:hypothetical protein